MEVDVFEPVSNIEARTVLSDIRQVAVAQNLGIGIIHAQAMQQFLHRHFLGEVRVSAGWPFASSPPS